MHMVHHQAKLDKTSSLISEAVPSFGGWGEWVRGAKSQVFTKTGNTFFVPSDIKKSMHPLSFNVAPEKGDSFPSGKAKVWGHVRLPHVWLISTSLTLPH